tara:strand:+ start:6297 stop:8405 length:2109 start_codon:yes stop_codon:yes gene_type:complete
MIEDADKVEGEDHSTAEADFRDTFKNPKQPSDFETAHQFIGYAVKLFDDDLQHDKKNRDQAIEDAQFAVGEQWDDWIKQLRVAANKPTMVFNRLPAFIGAIVGNLRQNETDIKIVADDTKYIKNAIVREGLVRSIQKNSRSVNAYNKAFENQVIAGMGNFEVNLEYASNDVFEQNIRINQINNPFSVVWDRFYQEPTGHDAGHVFTTEVLTHEAFRSEWPNATAGDPSTDTRELGYDISPEWIDQDDVRIVNFWRMRSKRRILALLKDEDGSTDTVDITDMAQEEFQDRLVVNDQGLPVMRETDVKYAQLYVITATDILEGPYDLPISRVPVFAVPGWEINVGEYRTRFGIVRFLKDPQRLHNYWRSIIAEKLMLTPKGNWIATEEAVAGREDEWRESHLSDDPLLIWNGEAGMAPQRVEPSQIENGFLQQAGMAEQDLRDISNIHEANLGKQSNEVSGKAINARVKVGETGSAIYQDNLGLAKEACGIVIDELIPHAYSTARVIKVMGVEGEDLGTQVINDITNKDSIDITAGKYEITATTGPSTVTKRAEAAEGMLTMVNAAPDLMGQALPDIIEAQDWPNARTIAKRLRVSMGAGFIREGDLTPEEEKAAAAAAEQQQVQTQKEDAMLAADLREKEARADQAEAYAMQARANAFKAIESVDIDKFKAVADVEEKEFKRTLEAMKSFNEMTPELPGEEPI